MKTKGFTLLELLVVIGLVAGLSFVLFRSLEGGSKAAALHSAQTMVANLITAARTKAPATNRKVRVLVNADSGHPARYLRYLLLQIGRQSGTNPSDWDTVRAVFLPSGTYILPPTLAGLVAVPSEWKRQSEPEADLASDLFVNQTLDYTAAGDTEEQLWMGMAFTPNGTLASIVAGPPPKGSLVIALGRLRTTGTYAEGEPPVELDHRARVRGMVLSAYGVPALLDGPDAF